MIVGLLNEFTYMDKFIKIKNKLKKIKRRRRRRYGQVDQSINVGKKSREGRLVTHMNDDPKLYFNLPSLFIDANYIVHQKLRIHLALIIIYLFYIN